MRLSIQWSHMTMLGYLDQRWLKPVTVRKHAWERLQGLIPEMPFKTSLSSFHSPVSATSFSFLLFFFFIPPLFLPIFAKENPLPKVNTCCTIHHLSRLRAPTTTMAPVTCYATCLQQLASRSWSPSPALQEVVVHPGCSMRGLQYHILYIWVFKTIYFPHHQPKT